MKTIVLLLISAVIAEDPKQGGKGDPCDATKLDQQCVDGFRC